MHGLGQRRRAAEMRWPYKATSDLHMLCILRDLSAWACLSTCERDHSGEHLLRIDVVLGMWYMCRSEFQF
jgi:hypothetical protein